MKFKDLPFEPKYTPEVYELAKEWLVKNQPSFVNTANFAIFNTEGQVESRLNQICHRAISSPTLANRCLVVSEVGLRRRDSKTSPIHHTDWGMSWKDAEPFLKWWLYESYMGRFILNRDDISFIKQYGIIVSADIPAPLLQNIMIVSRHFWEINADCFRRFKHLVELGADGLLAYMVTFNTGCSIVDMNEDSVVTSYSSHRAHPCLTLSGMRNAFKDEVGTLFKERCRWELTEPQLLYRVSPSYTGGTAFFLDSSERPKPGVIDGNVSQHFVYGLCAEDKAFREALSAHRHRLNNVEMYRPPNPFKKTDGLNKPTRPDQVSYKELYDFIVPYLIENPHILNCQEQSKEMRNAA